MDKISNYQNIIVEYLTEWANFGTPPTGLEHQVIADRENHHFQWVTTGWLKDKEFVYITELHLAIKNGKIWVWQNNSDAMVADDLMERGVLKSDIVLAFHAPQDRALTGYAVA